MVKVISCLEHLKSCVILLLQVFRGINGRFSGIRLNKLNQEKEELDHELDR